jgi:hypothetical protein
LGDSYSKILPILLTEMGASKAAKLAAKITGIVRLISYHYYSKIVGNNKL